MAKALTQGPEVAFHSRPRSDYHPIPPPTLPTTSRSLLTSAAADETTPEQRKLSPIASAGLRTSPSPLVARSKSTSRSPRPMATGTTSERPLDSREDRRSPSSSQSHLQTAQAALGAIMGVSDDDRRPDKPDAPSNHVSKSRSVSAPRSPSERREEELKRRSASPVAMTDAFGNGDENNEGSNNTMTTNVMIHGSTVASPGPIEEEPASMETAGSQQHGDNEERDGLDSNKALSYPAPLPAVNLNDPRRGMSLPHAGLHKGSPRSPGGSKKHQCNFCGTEFTRHHNLKSHLLTHSQEKPYVCQTCKSRFRRLHDLKRHTKLHTGERPHICPKCGRRFARGDALARHNKGSGGCAGRRSSMGSFAGGDDEFGDGAGDDAMQGVVFDEPDRIDEEDERRFALPSIRRHGSPSDSHSHPQSSSGRHVSFQSHTPNTYPPLGMNRTSHPHATATSGSGSGSGGLLPPASTQAGSSSSASPISPSANASLPHSGTSGSSTLASGQRGSSPSIFAQSTMTESPKPLSPSAMSSRQLGHGSEAGGNAGAHQRQSSFSHSTTSHSPSSKPQPLPPASSSSQHHHNQQFGRGRESSGTGIGFPPSLNLPAPQSSSGAPQLPPPPGLNPPTDRFSFHTPHSGASSRSPLLSPAPSAGRPDPHAPPPHLHSRSSTDNIPNVHEALSQSSNNNNHHTATTSATASSMFQHQQQRQSPQRQLSNPSSGSMSGAGANDSRLWGYVKTLEDRVGGLEGEIARLREQLSASQGGGEVHGHGSNHGHGHGTSATNGP